MLKVRNKAIIYSLFLIIVVSTLPSLANNRLAKADSLFALRNTNFDVQQLLADPFYVNQAIRIYKNVVVSTADSQEKAEALWKLLRCYYFKGQFVTDKDDIRQVIYKEGIDLGEQYIKEIPESVESYMWLGINWARWAEVSGIYSAARNDVAGKVKKYAEKTIALDEYYLDAGGYRLLGMLHLSVPYIPFVLTWPSNKEALANLNKAYNIAPDNLYNKMYLAMGLHEEDQDERSKSLLLEIINTKGIVHDLAIDAFIKEEARNYLSEEF